MCPLDNASLLRSFSGVGSKSESCCRARQSCSIGVGLWMLHIKLLGDFLHHCEWLNVADPPCVMQIDWWVISAFLHGSTLLAPATDAHGLMWLYTNPSSSLQAHSQGHLVNESTGIGPCPRHQLGMRDPDCDHCKERQVHCIDTRSKAIVICRCLLLIYQDRILTVRMLFSAQYLGDMRQVWAFGIDNRQSTTVLFCLQSGFEDLRSLTAGSRPLILRLHSDKAKEFLSPLIRAYLSQQGVRQTMNSGYDPPGNGLAERWVGIIEVRATALAANERLPPEYWSYACRWVAYIHTHRVTEIAIDKGNS